MDYPTRIERDSLGELPVPATALYGIQTQHAVLELPCLRLTSLEGIHLVDGDHQARCSRGPSAICDCWMGKALPPSSRQLRR